SLAIWLLPGGRCARCGVGRHDDRRACARYSSVFFFQAEDGIRDFHVTGVQTCALPSSVWARRSIISRRSGCRRCATTSAIWWRRSEERRVGEECRAGGLADHQDRDNPTNGEEMAGTDEKGELHGGVAPQTAGLADRRR